MFGFIRDFWSSLRRGRVDAMVDSEHLLHVDHIDINQGSDRFQDIMDLGADEFNPPRSNRIPHPPEEEQIH